MFPAVQAETPRHSPSSYMSPGALVNLTTSRPLETAKRLKPMLLRDSLSTESQMSKSIVGELFGEHWVLISRVVEHTGYSDDAIRAKKRRGEWSEGVHWRKAPDNRVVFNLDAIQAWMGGHHA